MRRWLGHFLVEGEVDMVNRIRIFREKFEINSMDNISNKKIKPNLDPQIFNSIRLKLLT